MWVKAILQSERGTHVGGETKCQTKKKKKKRQVCCELGHMCTKICLCTHTDVHKFISACKSAAIFQQMRPLWECRGRKYKRTSLENELNFWKVKNKFTKNRIRFWKQIKVCSSFVAFIPFLFPDKKYPDQTTFLRANLSQNSLQAKTATSQPSRKCSKPPALWGWFKG